LTIDGPPARPRKGPSMSDVARRAGVALGTVSNVLNNPEIVSDDTIKRVQTAIDQLGFVRNRAARSLAAGTSSTIGFVLADLSNSFFVDMARGAEEVAEEFRMSLLLADSDVIENKQRRYLELFDEERVAGILLAPIPGLLGGLRPVLDHGRDVVLLNDTAESIELCSVVVNNEHGGYLAAKHLIELGRRRIMFAGGDSPAPLRDRQLGVRRAVAETGEGVAVEFIPTPEVRAADGRLVGELIKSRPPLERPDAIVAGADLLALGILQSFADADIRVPDDIAIIGHDNNRAAWDSVIPLSTIAQPGQDVGAAAARLLVDEIRSAASHRHRTVTLEPTLVVRESTVGRR
jgi:LacI family transcriptional regulator